MIADELRPCRADRGVDASLLRTGLQDDQFDLNRADLDDVVRLERPLVSRQELGSVHPRAVQAVQVFNQQHALRICQQIVSAAYCVFI